MKRVDLTGSNTAWHSKKELSDRLESKDPGTISQLRQFMFTQRKKKNNKISSEKCCQLKHQYTQDALGEFSGSCQCCSFSPMFLFLVCTKCNKWEYFQIVTTSWNEPDVLECPCNKRTAHPEQWMITGISLVKSCLLFYWMPYVSMQSAFEMSKHHRMPSIIITSFWAAVIFEITYDSRS